MKLGMSERNCFGIGVQGVGGWGDNPALDQIRTQGFPMASTWRR